MYGVVSNPVSLRIAYTFQGEVIADTTFEEEPLKGRKLQLVKFRNENMLKFDKNDLPLKARL